MEKILIIILVIIALGAFAWSALGFFTAASMASSVENTPENLAKFKAAELPDKCQTPPGYTDKDWLEHMSHHPDQYRECFDSPGQ